MGFFIFKARLAFIQLKQVFIIAYILNYFNLKDYIWIETDILNFAISEILS